MTRMPSLVSAVLRRAFLTPVLPGPRPRRVVQLLVGLYLYGLGLALQITSDLGAAGWDVLHQGLARQTGLSIGAWNILIGAFVMLLWIPLRQRAGLGTISNVLLVGVSFDVSLWWLPEVDGLAARWLCLLLGIVVTGFATGCYIGAELGPGPRDGLMTGLVARGYSLRVVRTGIEVAVVVAGFLLGGTVGIGTLLFALAIGQLAHVFLPLLRVPAPAPAPAE
ncbi:YczE/YyaS/YitT family protein [Marinactinospora rubrisoli]|uniref:YitT family protein n=1 Tax=Marinactinospora rubrisoli TaxID=2715399 RepID=A0ABW2KEU8_9ACTN